MTFSLKHLVLAGNHLPAALLAMALLAASGAVGIAAISQRLALSRRKVFYDKFARQIARMGVLWGTLATVAACATAFVWATRPGLLHLMPSTLPKALTGAPALWLPAAAALVCGLALAAIHLALWPRMKNARSLHSLCGGAARLTSLAAAFGLLGLARLVYGDMPVPDGGAMARLAAVYAAPLASPLWPLLAQAVLLSCGAAAALGLGYLLLRRNSEDFGRDYYTFCLHYCAKWACITTLLQLVAQGWLFALLRPSMGAVALTNPAYALWGMAVAATLAACLLWGAVIKSHTPLRHKAAIALAPALLLVAIACQGTALLYTLI
ncbi:MAG: hypothetical protein AB7E47_02470 [Desulfovibrionaceae bacterium]